MENVSMQATAGKAWLLIRNRSREYWMYFGAFILLYGGPALFLEQASPEMEISPLGGTLAVAGVVSYIAITVSAWHFTIASCRNRTSFIPERPMFTFARFLVMNLALGLIGALGYALCAVPLLTFAPPAFGAFWSLLALLVGALPVLRLGPILPAIAIGDECSFSKAWKMTKGYNVQLALAMLTVALPSFGFALAMEGLSPDSGMQPNLAVSLLNTVFSILVAIFSIAFCGVLYEELSNRHEQAQMQAGD